VLLFHLQVPVHPIESVDDPTSPDAQGVRGSSPPRLTIAGRERRILSRTVSRNPW
jgi:hypothetical protein